MSYATTFNFIARKADQALPFYLMATDGQHAWWTRDRNMALRCTQEGVESVSKIGIIPEPFDHASFIVPSGRLIQ